MRFAQVAFAALAAMAVSLPMAQAESPWYASGSLGVLQSEDTAGPSTIHILGTSTFIPDERRASFDPGFLANLAVGYHLPAGFRIEGEFGYAHFNGDKLNVTSAQPVFNGDFKSRGGDDFNQYMVTVNGFYDIPVPWAVVPYVGIGMGAAHEDESSNRFFSSNGAFLTHNARSANDIVALIEGGLAIPVSGSLAIVPAYRYLHIFRTESGVLDGAEHIIKLGLRYSFY